MIPLAPGRDPPPASPRLSLLADDDVSGYAGRKGDHAIGLMGYAVCASVHRHERARAQNTNANFASHVRSGVELGLKNVAARYFVAAATLPSIDPTISERHGAAV
jgi:hypothetical protein